MSLIECQVIFKVHALTQPNETVKIVGNTEELGLWNIEQAFVLSTDDAKYPEWTNEIALIVPKGTRLEFKLVIVKGTQVQWEGLPQNRKYRTRYCRVVLKAQWNNCEGGVVVEKKFRSSISLNPTVLQNYRKKKMGSDFDPFEQEESSESDDRDSFSMSMTDFLPLGDDENYSIGSIPRSKSKKIHHNMDNSIIEEEDDVIKGSSKFDDLHKKDNLQQDLSRADTVIVCTFYLPIQITFLKEDNIFTFESVNYYNENEDPASLSNQIMQALSMLPCKSILVGIPIIRDDLNQIISSLTVEQQNECKLSLNQKYNFEPIFFDTSDSKKLSYEFKCEAMKVFKFGGDNIVDPSIYIEINQKFSTLVEQIITQQKPQNCLTMILDDRLLFLPSYLFNRPVTLLLINKFPHKDQLEALSFHKELIKSILVCNQILFPNYETASNLLDLLTSTKDTLVRSQKGSLMVNFQERDIQIKIKATGMILEGQIIKQILRSTSKSSDGSELLIQKNQPIQSHDKLGQKKNQTLTWLEESLNELKQNQSQKGEIQIEVFETIKIASNSLSDCLNVLEGN